MRLGRLMFHMLQKADGWDKQLVDSERKRLGYIWIKCSSPVIIVGLTQILEKEARVYSGSEPADGEAPDFVVLCTASIAAEDLPESIEHLRELLPGTPVLVFGVELDLSLAQTALKAGAMGFIHADMQPGQIVRALMVASEGQVAAPRQMLEYMLAGGDRDKLAALSFRQQEILELVTSGLSNAQIAQRLYLSESTIKQHLRAAYKLLDVKNRTEAARLFREV